MEPKAHLSGHELLLLQPIFLLLLQSLLLLLVQTLLLCDSRHVKQWDVYPIHMQACREPQDDRRPGLLHRLLLLSAVGDGFYALAAAAAAPAAPAAAV